MTEKDPLPRALVIDSVFPKRSSFIKKRMKRCSPAGLRRLLSLFSWEQTDEWLI